MILIDKWKPSFRRLLEEPVSANAVFTAEVAQSIGDEPLVYKYDSASNELLRRGRRSERSAANVLLRVILVESLYSIPVDAAEMRDNQFTSDRPPFWFREGGKPLFKFNMHPIGIIFTNVPHDCEHQV